MSLAVATRGRRVACCSPGILQAVWDAYYSDYDGWVGIPAGEGWARLTRAEAAARALGSGYGNLRHRVRQWVENPDVFSPHIDRIAVERAKMLDGDVIANLTGAEWNVLVDELAHLPAERVPWNDAMVGENWTHLPAEARDNHEWWALPLAIRSSLRKAVSGRRTLLGAT